MVNFYWLTKCQLSFLQYEADNRDYFENSWLHSLNLGVFTAKIHSYNDVAWCHQETIDIQAKETGVCKKKYEDVCADTKTELSIADQYRLEMSLLPMKGQRTT